MRISALLLALLVARCAADAKVEELNKNKWNTLPTEKHSNDANLISSGDVDQDEYEYNDEEEGSGDDEDDGDYLYDDDEDDDDWYDDEDDQVANKSKKDGKTSSNDDIHLEKDDDLYEYYNSEYYDDYEFDEENSDDIKTDENDTIDIDGEEPVVSNANKNNDKIPEPEQEEESAFALSYIYVMLASFVLSFALVLIVFMLCRRSALDRQEKKLRAATAPFVVSTTYHGHPEGGKLYAQQQSTPIVKNYQRVPSSAREFLNEKQQPLLT